MHKYEDIINMEYKLKNHSKMPIYKRASIFAPFSALTGFNDIIMESQRITSLKRELNQDQIDEINRILIELDNSFNQKIKLEYFLPDILKEGGSYQIYTGYIKKINKHKKEIILDNNEIIKIENIYKIIIL